MKVCSYVYPMNHKECLILSHLDLCIALICVITHDVFIIDSDLH